MRITPIELAQRTIQRDDTNYEKSASMQLSHSSLLEAKQKPLLLPFISQKFGCLDANGPLTVLKLICYSVKSTFGMNLRRMELTNWPVPAPLRINVRLKYSWKVIATKSYIF